MTDLTKKQFKAYGDMLDFIERGKERCLTVLGRGGSGKTYTLARVVRGAGISPEKIVIMGTTHASLGEVHDSLSRASVFVPGENIMTIASVISDVSADLRGVEVDT